MVSVFIDQPLATTRHDADTPHLRNDRLVGGVRRVHFQELGRVGKEPLARHGIGKDLGRSLDVDARVNRRLDRLCRLAPLRQRRDLVAGLHLVYRIVIGRPICLGAADDPDIRRGRGNPRHA